MIVTVKQGNLNVIQTGAILVSNNEATTITVDNDYNIMIYYKDDQNDKTQDISVQAREKGISIELKNFNNPLGTSTTSPIPIAKQGQQTIYISLTVTAIGQAKILYYGLYLGK